MQQFDGFTLCGYLFKTCQHQGVNLERQTDSGLGGFHQLKNVVFTFGKAFLLGRTKIRPFIKYHILNYFNWVKFLPFCVSTMGHSKKITLYTTGSEERLSNFGVSKKTHRSFIIARLKDCFEIICGL